MRFDPITSKYKFDSTLIRHYPDYLQGPLVGWMERVLIISGMGSSDPWGGLEHITKKFSDDLDVTLRCKFPRSTGAFFNFILDDSDLTSNFLGLLLQNYALPEEARELEDLLARSGSAYSVVATSQVTSAFDKGKYNLVERVPGVVLDASGRALDSEPLLRDAWHACYSRNPNYAEVVSKSVDVLEGVFRDKYFPNDTKPSLTRFVKDFRSNPGKLIYHGNSLIDPKNLLTDLSEVFISVRGQHTSGTGRLPTKEEAIFVLHYAIFVWNLHK